AGREGARLVGVGAVVVGDDLQLLPVHAALGVERLDIEVEGALLRIAEERRRSGDRQHRADLDLRGRLLSGAEQTEQGDAQSDALQYPHGRLPGGVANPGGGFAAASVAGQGCTAT